MVLSEKYQLIRKLARDFCEKEIPKELQDDYTYYLNQVIFERNEQMADKAVEYMKNGNNYFFMVGAAHFAGSKGVDDILAERGYKVERVA